jgi:transglutaminase-like putative cysteine protease
MIYRTVHTTEYVYGAPVSTSHHELHLSPRATAHQRVLQEEVVIAPAPAARRDRQDAFGNRCTYLEMWAPHRVLTVVSRAEVEVADGPIDGVPPSPPWDEVREGARRPTAPDWLEAAGFVFPSPYVSISTAAAAYAAPSFPPGRPVLEAAQELSSRIHADFTYDQRATTVATPVEEVLVRRRGVCQDFAHLALACLRALGLPARYVSGYLATTAPPGRQRLTGADASHAWLSVYSPGTGWLDLDPTNDVIPGDRHITVAWGRDFGDVTPIRGVIMGGGDHDLTVSVDVSPVEALSPSP